MPELVPTVQVSSSSKCASPGSPLPDTPSSGGKKACARTPPAVVVPNYSFIFCMTTKTLRTTSEIVDAFVLSSIVTQTTIYRVIAYFSDLGPIHSFGYNMER